jgi:hypothetical protein
MIVGPHHYLRRPHFNADLFKVAQNPHAAADRLVVAPVFGALSLVGPLAGKPLARGDDLFLDQSVVAEKIS